MNRFLSFLLSFLFFFSVTAQKKDSLWQFNDARKFSYGQLIPPAALVASGTVINFTEKRKTDFPPNQKHPGFGSYAEDYVQFAPLAANTVFDLVGMHSRTDRVNKLAIGVKSTIISFATINGLKALTKKMRPDGSKRNSFPSAHTATAFSGATSLAIEYGKNNPWIPYAAYGVAAGVGALRVVHNKHYVSDVLVGAAVGILSTKIAYWTHQYRWKAKKGNDVFSGVIYDKAP